MPRPPADRRRILMGERITDAMELAGLNSRALAGRTGQHPTVISAYLTGRRPVSARVLGLIATACRVSLDDLLAGPGAPMRLTGPRPGTCPVSILVDMGGVTVTFRLLCDLDEGPEHPVAHLDPNAVPGGLWWFAGTDAGAAAELAWQYGQLAGPR